MKLDSWIIYALLAMLAWGFWGFFPKLAIRHLDPMSSLLYQEVGAIIVGIIVLFLMRFQLAYHPTGVSFAVIAGAAAMVGGLLYLYSLRTGPTAPVVIISGLYPLITILLAAVVLREPLTWKQGVGVVLGLVAIGFLVL